MPAEIDPGGTFARDVDPSCGWFGAIPEFLALSQSDLLAALRARRPQDHGNATRWRTNGSLAG